MRRPILLFRYFGFHLLLFIVAAVVFCWPFGSGAHAREAGAMFVYLLVAWSFFIAVLWVVGRHPGLPDPEPDGGSLPGEGEPDV